MLFGFRAYFRFVATHTSAFRLLFGDGVRLDSEFARAVQTVERELAELIASMITIEHLDDEGRLVLAHGIVGLAEANYRAILQHGSLKKPMVREGILLRRGKPYRIEMR